MFEVMCNTLPKLIPVLQYSKFWNDFYNYLNNNVIHQFKFRSNGTVVPIRKLVGF